MEKTQFDLIASEYDQIFPFHITRYYLKKRKNFIKKLLVKGSILDVGCGTGLLADELSEEDFSVVGVDASLNMLSARRQPKSVLVCGMSDFLPFKSESFDLVMAVAMLHHLLMKEKVWDTISEMVRITKRRGIILVWDHNPANPYWPILMKKVPQDRGDERLVPLAEIIDGIKHCGVTKIKNYKKGFIPEFIPHFMMPLFRVIEWCLERMLLIRNLAAHNVICAFKD